MEHGEGGRRVLPHRRDMGRLERQKWRSVQLIFPNAMVPVGGETPDNISSTATFRDLNKLPPSAQRQLFPRN